MVQTFCLKCLPAPAFRPGLGWRSHRIGTEQLRSARSEFAHSFGSCSFEEPVGELRELGLLP